MQYSEAMSHTGSRSSHVPAATSLLIAVIVFTVAATLFVALQVHHPDTTKADRLGPDLHVCFIPSWERAAAQIRAGRLPLWDPYQGCGTPLAGQLYFGPFYPPNLLYVLADSGTALDLLNVVHLSLAGVLMWLYCRSAKLSASAALLGGTMFMFAPFLTDRLNSPPFIYSAALIPGAMLAAERIASGAERRHVWAVLLSAVLALQFTAGHTFITLATGELICAYIIVQGGLRGKRRGKVKAALLPIAWLGGSALVAGLITLPQVIITAELGQSTWRSSLSFASYQGILSLFGWSLRDLAHQISGGASYAASCPWFYVGVAAPALSLVAIGLSGKGVPRWRVWFFAVLAVVGIVCSVADFKVGAFLGWRMMLGMSRDFRFFPTLYLFSVAYLAAVGFEYCVHRTRDGMPRWGNVLIALSALIAALTFIDTLPRGKLVLMLSGAFILALRFADGTAGVDHLFLSARRRERRNVARSLLGTLLLVSLLGLTMSDLWNRATRLRRQPAYKVSPIQGETPAEYIEYLRNHSDSNGRIWSLPLLFGSSSSAIPHVRMWGSFGLYGTDDFTPFMLNRHLELVEAMTRPEDRGAYTNFHVGSVYIDKLANSSLPKIVCTRFFVVPAERDFIAAGEAPPGFPAVRRVFDAEGVRIYEDPAPLSRAHWVDAESVRYFSKASDALDYMCSEEFDPFTQAVIELEKERPFLIAGFTQSDESAGENRDGEADVELVRSEPDRVQVDVHAPREGFLVLADTYYPGWRAHVNGTRSRIYRANYLFRAVALPAGDHTVVFRYCPTNFYVGIAISLSVLASLCFLGIRCLLGGRRRAATATDAKNGSEHKGGGC